MNICVACGHRDGAHMPDAGCQVCAVEGRCYRYVAAHEHHWQPGPVLSTDSATDFARSIALVCPCGTVKVSHRREWGP